jgi:hypothetical protein
MQVYSVTCIMTAYIGLPSSRLFGFHSHNHWISCSHSGNYEHLCFACFTYFSARRWRQYVAPKPQGVTFQQLALFRSLFAKLGQRDWTAGVRFSTWVGFPSSPQSVGLLSRARIKFMELYFHFPIRLHAVMLKHCKNLTLASVLIASWHQPVELKKVVKNPRIYELHTCS